jgi:hypothetical protein
MPWQRDIIITSLTSEKVSHPPFGATKATRKF